MTYLVWTSIVDLLAHVSTVSFSNSLAACADAFHSYFRVTGNWNAYAHLRCHGIRGNGRILLILLSFLHFVAVDLFLHLIRLSNEINLSIILRCGYWQLTTKLFNHLPIAFLSDFIRRHSWWTTTIFVHFVLWLHPVSIVLPLRDRSKPRWVLVCRSHWIWLNVEIEAISASIRTKLTFLLYHCWGVAHRP